ncbi:MAG: hypothetical protein EOO38_14545 [Cytophagaceae bacterium]|nr:MAG: hypothetical protein EOO38_14545 [Cytophagaceae bacterium]
MGHQAGYSNTTSRENSFMGASAGYYNTTGSSNTFMGYGAGGHNTIGSSNTFMGDYAGQNNTTGGSNSFVGYRAGFLNTSGGSNTFLGYQAGYNVTTGSHNIIIGPASGTAITTSDDNVLMGYNSQADEGIFNGIAIGSHSRVASSNSMILGNGVNVGIGTSAPTARLHVRSEQADASGVRLEQLTSQSPATLATDQFLTVNGVGDVVKARYQLRINHASEWSDKVFSPGYRLRSLDSVARFIKQNSHLPGIPSADQVAKDGVELVKLNALLLEKVEELTLYSIELEKKASKQAKINQQQEAKIEQLTRLVKQFLERK